LPGWAWLFELSPEERVKVLADPEKRAPLQQSLMDADTGLASTVRTQWGKFYVNDPKNPAMAHLDGKPIAEIAQERGISDFDAACAIAAEAGLKVGLVRLSYDLLDEWTDNARIEVLKDPRVVLGASDGGAHMDMMVGSDFPTRCLGELVRERGVFTLEELIRQFTDVPARLYGLTDRGRLAPGHWADIVIFDPASVDAGPLRTVTDLPANGSRLMTKPVGVRHVLVAGEELIRDGEPTANRPGQLLRSGKDTVTVFAREEVAA
jgi:N-acyl-D-aspartate/D-glutamate deacylase